jgi:hypothetical protein
MAATGLAALSSIGMSVEGALKNFGQDLRDELAGLSEEEKRKRQQALQQQRLLGGTGANALASVMGGPAAAGSIGGSIGGSMSLGRYGL